MTGLSAADFLALTPRETETIGEACAEIQHNQLMTLAFMSARFSRVKKLVNTTLKAFLYKQPKRQTATSQIAIMEKWRQRTAHLPPRIQR